MNIFYWIAGVVLALAWFSRVLDAGFGGRSMVDLSAAERDRDPHAEEKFPRVSVIVPARNEQATIAENLGRLLNQNYDNFEVIAVDDRSSDQTGAIMDEVMLDAAHRRGKQSLHVLHVQELPPGWMGKVYAMWSASLQASGEWLLFTDADVMFEPQCLRRAIAYAEEINADHLVVFPKVNMHSVGERMMIGFFQLLFLFGHRPWKVADPDAKDYIGVGAFNLIRRSVYDAIGTYRAVRMEVLDDMKLGKLVKDHRFRQRVAYGYELLSLRWADGAIGVVHNLTKNLFAVLQYKFLKSLGACFALVFLNLFPFLGLWLAHGWSKAGYAIALASMFMLYFHRSRRDLISPLYFFLHPISTLLFLYGLLRSMFLTLWQGGVIWRGTLYPLEELKKGIV